MTYLFNMFYNKQSQEITREEWVELFMDKDYSRVAQDEVGKYNISTVWLGLDHNYLREGGAHIFETMVFIGNDSVEVDRYNTIEQAKEGHKVLVEKYERNS